ncbi:hypothetical protein DERF_001799 [Dermatophagoides farinae]|uniref:Uncharacterized protein n=1 Tax=Dermatophagoides farinae TaxID=6954 RepID=A0A922IBJ6_DERFA|nr:hypothetical protein DERF_009123 [Dermatophagoides farinae]KAH9510629.1 hypothetical protein DERF_009145 [Dermatophagoides farinae]KAH9511313.1 hypothetical protein DERF_009783 [Dermatophagoides farinae]KAH9527803.1 hypothetical protein DERF_001799 [Dermatophagoides farinae]
MNESMNDKLSHCFVIITLTTIYENHLIKYELATKTRSRFINLLASENLFSKSMLPITFDA